MANPGKAQFKKQQSFIPTEQTTANLDYLGPSVPTEITKMILLLSKLQRPHFRSILQFTINYLKGHSDATDQSTGPSPSTSRGEAAVIAEKEAETEGFRDLLLTLNHEGAALSGPALTSIFGGMYMLLRAAYRQRIEVLLFQASLNELQFPQEFAADLVHSYKKTRDPMAETFSRRHIMFPQVESFRWRVDVVLSTSSIEKMADPSILIEMQLSDGRSVQFECSVTKFHELRYNVARVLKDMGDLERAPILKLNK